ncbi:caspase domain-containing protein [Coprinopsis sp. MPI-PUGE-AT-0042]|nr:caspase domain-containing protein [Coprinopsis sp. MPI-PUGE-AT-0042]
MSLFAVTIGINKYSNSGLQRLRGAVADAKSIVQFLTESGVPLDRIRSLYDEQATREAIKSELQSLANNPVIKENDPILVYFAGHGNNDRAPSSWGNWDDEWVQSLLPYDFNEPDDHDGVICGIPDRSLGTILRSIADAKGNNITVILDCCHSGSGTRCANTLIRSGPLCKIPIPPDLDNDLFPATVRSANPQAALPKFRHQGMKSHVLLAACKPEEVAHEEEAQGRFTRELLVTLRSLDIKSVTYLELIRCLKPLPSQNPQCEGIGDRLLFNNDIRSVKGYYRAKANNSSGGPRLQVEAGRIHGITDDTIFDVWADFLLEYNAHVMVSSLHLIVVTEIH